MWKDDEEYGPMIARLGPRLKELRRRAGLNQEEIAARMGMTSPNKRMICRLESGRTGNPGLASVARYLRACRAGFVDVLDVLEEYTRQAPVPEAGAAKAIADLEARLRGEVSIPGECRSEKLEARAQNGGEGKGQKAKAKSQSEDRPRTGGGWR